MNACAPPPQDDQPPVAPDDVSSSAADPLLAIPRQVAICSLLRIDDAGG